NELAQLAVDYNIIEKSGSWFSYQGDRIGQGMASVNQFLKEKPDVQVEIEEQVKKALSGKEEDQQ
ncbi:MAG: DNA recombination/repair protein RecA, partial [Bacilli bacterium]|nr:DNA recombination/repair protein RecA [Bacilli bacterium]